MEEKKIRGKEDVEVLKFGKKVLERKKMRISRLWRRKSEDREGIGLEKCNR